MYEKRMRMRKHRRMMAEKQWEKNAIQQAEEELAFER